MLCQPRVRPRQVRRPHGGHRGLLLRDRDGPDRAGLYNNRGLCYAEAGDDGEAIRDYTRAIERNPDLAKAWHNRGSALSRQGRHERALADFERAIALDPSDPQVYRNRAVALLHLGAYERARQDVATCRRLGGTPDPKLVQALSDATR